MIFNLFTSRTCNQLMIAIVLFAAGISVVSSYMKARAKEKFQDMRAE